MSEFKGNSIPNRNYIDHLLDIQGGQRPTVEILDFLTEVSNEVPFIIDSLPDYGCNDYVFGDIYRNLEVYPYGQDDNPFCDIELPMVEKGHVRGLQITYEFMTEMGRKKAALVFERNLNRDVDITRLERLGLLNCEGSPKFGPSANSYLTRFQPNGVYEDMFDPSDVSYYDVMHGFINRWRGAKDEIRPFRISELDFTERKWN